MMIHGIRGFVSKVSDIPSFHRTGFIYFYVVGCFFVFESSKGVFNFANRYKLQGAMLGLSKLNDIVFC